MAKSTGLEPATSIIRLFGGNKAVSEITGVHVTRVSNWKRSKESGGTGGIIPFKHAPKLLAAAHEMGIPLDAKDFLPNGNGNGGGK